MGQVQFRDGPRGVPQHLEEMLRGIDTYKMTYEQAIAEMHRRAESDAFAKARNRAISEHFRGFGGGS